MIKAGYDTRLTAFELLIPALLKAYDGYVSKDTLLGEIVGPIKTLRSWDFRSGENSVATTLAIQWGSDVQEMIRTSRSRNHDPDPVERIKKFIQESGSIDFVYSFLESVLELKRNYGRWEVPWGQIKRFQRISPDIDSKFDDTKASIPVGFVSSAWGMLPSYTSRTFPVRKRYGINGNSFICVV